VEHPVEQVRLVEHAARVANAKAFSLVFGELGSPHQC
jgi:hypothetical protein